MLSEIYDDLTAPDQPADVTIPIIQKPVSGPAGPAINKIIAIALEKSKVGTGLDFEKLRVEFAFTGSYQRDKRIGIYLEGVARNLKRTPVFNLE